MIEQTPHDLRYAMRTLRSNPFFALTAVLSLAIGIGAAIFHRRQHRVAAATAKPHLDNRITSS